MKLPGASTSPAGSATTEEAVKTQSRAAPSSTRRLICAFIGRPAPTSPRVRLLCLFTHARRAAPAAAELLAVCSRRFVDIGQLLAKLRIHRLLSALSGLERDAVLLFHEVLYRRDLVRQHGGGMVTVRYTL